MRTSRALQPVRLVLVFLMVSSACSDSDGGVEGAGEVPPSAPVPAEAADDVSTSTTRAETSAEVVDVLDRYQIDPAAHPKALCNDGTTPVFY